MTQRRPAPRTAARRPVARRPAPRPAGRRPFRRAVGPLVAAVLCVGVLFLAVFPTRTYLAQRAATDRALTQLDVLTAESEALEAQADDLQDDEEIERLARERYNLVFPGEEAYAVLPPPAPVTDVPVDGDGGTEDDGVVERVWDTLTGWF